MDGMDGMDHGWHGMEWCKVQAGNGARDSSFYAGTRIIGHG